MVLPLFRTMKVCGQRATLGRVAALGPYGEELLGGSCGLRGLEVWQRGRVRGRGEGLTEEWGYRQLEGKWILTPLAGLGQDQVQGIARLGRFSFVSMRRGLS